MQERYVIPATEARVELKVLNSRFIATAGPAFDVEQAKTFIGRVRAEFSDASHNVPAYVIGSGASVIAHCHDNGEPPGTAGRPVLAVLQGSGLGDTVIVVTRYFGGTKLGTGGLVRAYGDAAREALAVLPRAVKAATYVAMVVVPYPLLERARILIASHRGRILEEAFSGDVTITARFLVECFHPFQADLATLSNGQVEAMVIETDLATIVPLESTPAS